MAVSITTIGNAIRSTFSPTCRPCCDDLDPAITPPDPPPFDSGSFLITEGGFRLITETGLYITTE